MKSNLVLHIYFKTQRGQKSSKQLIKVIKALAKYLKTHKLYNKYNKKVKLRIKNKVKRYSKGKFKSKSKDQRLIHLMEEINEFIEEPCWQELADVLAQIEVWLN